MLAITQLKVTALAGGLMSSSASIAACAHGHIPAHRHTQIYTLLKINTSSEESHQFFLLFMSVFYENLIFNNATYLVI